MLSLLKKIGRLLGLVHEPVLMTTVAQWKTWRGDLSHYDLSQPAKMLIPSHPSGEPIWGWAAEWRRRERVAQWHLKKASVELASVVLDALEHG